MPELKFSAADTSLAMEQVEQKLGPDALILSTQRRDGLIEIIATNDPDQLEAASIKAAEKLKARKAKKKRSVKNLDGSPGGFADIIDVETSKYQDAKDFDQAASGSGQKPMTDPKLRSFKKSDIANEFSRITAELQHLIDGTMAFTLDVNNSVSTRSKLKMLGFSSNTIAHLMNEAEPNVTIDDVIDQFTKSIVHGKSREFDDSQIILVCGPEKSGKTVLSQKLSKFLPATLDGQANRVISDPLTGDLSSLFKPGLDANITSLFRKRSDVSLNSGRLIVDYEGSIDVLSSVLMKLERLEQKPNVSVVYALEVGQSYNAVKQGFEMAGIPNLCIALTKMDLLEVSVNELSAISDLGKKIQFFSGLKILEDGLDFAKVSVMKDFLSNLVKQEDWS